MNITQSDQGKPRSLCLHFHRAGCSMVSVMNQFPQLSYLGILWMEELVCGTLTCEERHQQMTNWKVFPQVLWKPSGKESVLQYVIQSRSNAETGNLTRTHVLLSNVKINSVFTSDKDVRRFCNCLVIYKTMELSVPKTDFFGGWGE